MTILVKRGDEIVQIPDCICPTRDGIRVEHPRCPTHGHDCRCHRRDCDGHWRVVGLPRRKSKPGE